MKPNTLFTNAVIGMIVTELLDAGYRVEVSDQDGGGTLIYALPGDSPSQGHFSDKWVALTLGNEPDTLIRDYSTSLEKILEPVNKFCDSLEE